LVALCCVAWLVLAVVVVSGVTGWDRQVVVSGSMQPSLEVGDLILTEPLGDEAAEQGDVITFRTPAGELVTHRVAAVLEDGSLRTRGDANASMDSDLVAPEQVEGVGRLVVPLVGVPHVWLLLGRWLDLLLLAAGLLLALVGAVVLARPPAPASAPYRGQHFAPHPRPRRRRWPEAFRAAGLAAALLVLIGVMADVKVGRAAFADQTANAVNGWTASDAFCTAGPSTVMASADANVRENQATSPFGTQTTTQVRSRNNDRDRRTFVQFALPAVPSRCQLASASLRVVATGSTLGRTIQVRRAASAWTESVTWNTQPAATGAVVPGASGTGVRTWDVTSLVLSQYLGSNFGFVVRDAAEGSSPAATQTYATRESDNDPELVLTWVTAP
jgi:signal peptidase I